MHDEGEDEGCHTRKEGLKNSKCQTGMVNFDWVRTFIQYLINAEYLPGIFYKIKAFHDAMLLEHNNGATMLLQHNNGVQWPDTNLLNWATASLASRWQLTHQQPKNSHLKTRPPQMSCYHMFHHGGLWTVRILTRKRFLQKMLLHTWDGKVHLPTGILA